MFRKTSLKFATKLKSESKCDEKFLNFFFSKIWWVLQSKTILQQNIPVLFLLFSFWQNLAQNEKMLGRVSVLGEAVEITALVWSQTSA